MIQKKREVKYVNRHNFNIAINNVAGKSKNKLANLNMRIAAISGKLTFKLLLYLFLIVVSFVFIYPLLYMLVTSIKSYTELIDTSINWVPRTFYWQNYSTALTYLNLSVNFKNSIILTGIATIGHILSCSYIAYGLSRFNFRGKNILFAIVIFSIIVPQQVIVLPLYMHYMRLGWLNSYLPILIPTFFGFGLRGGLYIFIFRQFFLGLPMDIEDAAQVDGYGYFWIYLRIVLPIARSAVLVCTVISIVWHWNDYFEPSLYISLTSKLPLPSMLNNVFNGPRDYFAALITDQLHLLVTDGVIMAAITICILPVAIIFLFLQKGFIEGVERTGMVE